MVAGRQDGMPARRLPRPRWVFATIFSMIFVVLLLVAAYANASFAPDEQHHRGGGQATVPDQVLAGGPVVSTANGEVRSFRMPVKTIALTFDDGPDPQWTPQIMRVLHRYQVPATFFVVGAHVTQHPQLVRQLVREGHEIGVHTFTHPHPSQLPAWRRQLEYSQTQMAIEYAAGVKTSLLRLPYSSRADAIDDDSWSLMWEAGQLGYLTVVSDIDSRDWERPGVDAIVRSATPPGEDGGVVLLHDAGGDRAQTVAALDRLVPQLKAHGYRFATVSQGINQSIAAGHSGAPAVSPVVRASAADVWRGWVLSWAVRLAGAAVRTMMLLLLTVGALTVLRTGLLFVFARRHTRSRPADVGDSGLVSGPVSVIVPAFNEERVIGKAVRSLALSDYPQLDVIVVDNGSTDRTTAAVAALDLPNVTVVPVRAAGKAGALNVGVALASHDLLVMVDSDTVVEPDTIRRLVQPFVDPGVGAVAGNVKVGNRTSLLARWQHIEYVIGFNLDRRVYDMLGCIPTVAGAIGAYRRSAVLQVGGVSDDTLAEDTDLTIALHRAGWSVAYQEHARGWTEAPATLRQLWNQRCRWSYGIMQALWKHRLTVVERGPAGRFGRRGLSLLTLFGVVLPLLGPLIDVMAVYGLCFFDLVETAVAWLGMLAVQAAVAIFAFRLDREPLGPLWALPLQQIVYRQVMYLVLIQSLVTALTGGRLRWHKLRRTGHAQPLCGAPAPTHAHLDDEVSQPQDDELVVASLPPPEIPSGALEALDAEFARLRLLADVDAALTHQTEDAVVPGLLTAGLEAWLAETDGVDDFTIDPPPGTKPSLHARLRRTLDEKTAAQAHWSFRAVAAPDPRATLSRLQAASTAAGLDTRPSQRFLFLLRNGEWSRGAKNQEILSKIYTSGGATLPLDKDDLRTLSALQRLLADPGPSLREWLRTRRPATSTRLLGAALTLAGPTPTPGPEPQSGGIASNTQPLNADEIVFGASMDTGAQIPIDPPATTRLRQHAERRG